MKQKSKLSKLNAVLAVVLAVVLIANVVVIATKAVPVAVDAKEETDGPVIEVFAEGTYGGVSFASDADVVKYYAEAYNKTKAQTKEYVLDSGETVTCLAPSASREPAADTDEDGQSLQTCLLVPEDVIATNVKDNNDGTITLQLQPKEVNMSHKGKDAQGHLFNSLGAIDSVVDSIDLLKWETGTTAENCLVNYKGGYATVTIDTASGLITTADYHMEAHISVNHANVTVLKDKSANLLVTYDVHYPASADYLKERVAATAK